MMGGGVLIDKMASGYAMRGPVARAPCCAAVLQMELGIQAREAHVRQRLEDINDQFRVR